MGGILAKGYSNEALLQSNVKLQAQSMPIFNGDPHRWQTWKKRARATIGSAGYLNILDQKAYAEKHRMKNETVFHLLQNATVEGHAAHLVDQFEPERDGRAAYMALCSWYEGDKQTNSTAEDIRAKLDRNFLSTKKSASQFINEFKTYNQQLKDLGEAYTKSKIVSIFLEKITDPDYENVVELCLAQDSSIEECIQQIQAKERRLDRNDTKFRRKPLSLRRNITEDEPSYSTDPILGERGSEYLNNNGYYSVPNKIWMTLTDEEKSKIKTHNSSLRKKRKRSEEKDNKSYSPRRTSQSNPDNDRIETDSKKQRTVQILEDERDPQEDQEEDEDRERMTSRRNGILKFKINST